MTRLQRKNRTDVVYKSGGVFDLIDNAVKKLWRINDEEYDYIIDNLTDDELSLFLLDKSFTRTQLKCMIEKINKILEKK
jgi:hypothetical protein